MPHDPTEFRTAYVALQQKSLDDDPLVPRWLKWVLRAIYKKYHWAATGHDGKSYCKIDFIGIFDNATDARWAAMVPGGSYRELPLNCSLPEESCQFGTYDHPMSEASQMYRKREMPFVAVPRNELEQLEDKVQETLDCAEGKCSVRVM